jgi:hypothetical protein
LKDMLIGVGPIRIYLSLQIVRKELNPVRFEVFTAVTMKNAVFWDVTPCGSC